MIICRKCVWIFLFVLLLFVFHVVAVGWDEITQKFNPGLGQVVAYDKSDCTAFPYIVFTDQPGTTYKNLTKWLWNAHGSPGGNTNDKISCFTVGPRTKFRYYQHADFKGKSAEVINDSYDSIKQVNIGGQWWDNSISSVKVWKLN